jgi:hypothetical protein
VAWVLSQYRTRYAGSMDRVSGEAGMLATRRKKRIRLLAQMQANAADV